MAIATCTSEVSSEVDTMIDEAAASAAAHPRLGYNVVKPEQREVVTAFEIATCIPVPRLLLSWNTTLTSPSRERW